MKNLKKINIGIIGLGYWGEIILKAAKRSKLFEISYICDLNKNNLSKFGELTDGEFTTNYSDILHDDNIEAVLVITEPHSHFKIVKDCLLSNKNVLVSKPMTTSFQQTSKLIKLANDKNLTLMEDLTWIYSNDIKEIKKLVKNKEFGEIVNIQSDRSNLGIYRKDIDVICDLASHDISIFNYIFDDKPLKVSAVGTKLNFSEFHHHCLINLIYEPDILVTINVNWLSPIKLRKISIFGEKQTLIFDDSNVIERTQLYRIEVDKETESKIRYDVLLKDQRNIETLGIEPLQQEFEEFRKSILNRKNNIHSLNDNKSIDNQIVLDKCSESLKSSGSWIYL